MVFHFILAKIATIVMLQKAMGNSSSIRVVFTYCNKRVQYLNVFHGSITGTRNQPVISSGSVGDVCFKQRRTRIAIRKRLKS